MPLDSIIRNASLSDIKEQMARLVKEGMTGPNLRRMTEVAISGADDPITGIYQYAKEHITYTDDPMDCERLVNPEWAAHSILTGKPMAEDCDGFATIIAAMGMSIGIPAKIVIVDMDGDGDWDHAYAQLYSDTLGWVNVDPTSDFPLGWVYTVSKETVVEFPE